MHPRGRADVYLMYADETNLEELGHTKFFIYGGLMIGVDAVEDLSTQIDNIRERHDFSPEDSLKFQAGSRPRHIDRDAWNTAKGEVVDACCDAGANFVAVLVHHRIARNKRDKLVEWQLNTLLGEFNLALHERDDVGIFLMDRLADGSEYRLMSDRFRRGSETTWGKPRTYPRVVAYASTCDGASHLSSAQDIVLGTFGYCVNERRAEMTRPSELMEKLAPLIRRSPHTGEVWDWGVMFNPRQSPWYGVEYFALRRHLKNLGIQQ